MGKKSKTEKYNEEIRYYIEVLKTYNGRYKYIGKDKDGLYLYDYIPSYNKERNVFEILNEKYHSFITYLEYNKNKDILSLFNDGEIILVEEGIERIEKLMNIEEKNVNKLFKLLSEVQGVEIKPYDMFNIKNENGLRGPYYFNEQFKRYDYNNYLERDEELLCTILTGESKVLKCKKAIVLTEDDIICLKYYLKNGYKYITNYHVYEKSTSTDVNNPIYIYGDFINGNKMFEIQDELSFVHHDHEDIWKIEDLLEQERVSND